MSSPPADVTATALAALVREGELSAAAAVEAALARIEQRDHRIGALLTVAAGSARREAAAADRAVRDGAELGPLHGVPIAVKDLEWTAGIRTTYGSRAFETFVPGEDAIDVARLRAAGAIVIGKTNTPEFGLIGETRNLPGRDVRPRRRQAHARQRAELAGTGRLAAVPGLGADRAHRRRRRAHAGRDVRARPARSGVALGWRAAGAPRRAGVAWSPDWGRLAVDDEVRRIAEAGARAFEDLGYCVETDQPDVGDAMDILLPLIAGDAIALLAGMGVERHLLSPEAREELEVLGEPDVIGYIEALNRLWHFRDAVDRFFESYDLMITPSTAVPAFPLGRPPAVIGGRAVEPRWTTFMPFQARGT